MIYNLCDGDFSKFESAKKMKVSEAGIVMKIKEINAFKQWYVSEVAKEN
jgi:hypothetical protein